MGTSLPVVRTLLLVAASLVASTGSRHAGFSNYGPRALARRLSKYGTLLDPGLNLCPLHWQANSQPLYHQGSPQTLNIEQKNQIKKNMCNMIIFV